MKTYKAIISISAECRADLVEQLDSLDSEMWEHICHVPTESMDEWKVLVTIKAKNEDSLMKKIDKLDSYEIEWWSET